MKTITYADFNSEEAREASKLVDYYEDEQSKYVKKLLEDKRSDWDTRGFTIQSRNIVKTIIDKSGLLFNAPPNLLVYPEDSKDGVQDKTFARVMDRADWIEFFQNVDVYTRLLKTTIVLQLKYIPDERSTIGGSYRYDEKAGDALMLRLLHQGNAVVRNDITGNRITELAYLTSPFSQIEKWTYRYINADAVEDWEVEGAEERRVNSDPNEDGSVPATPFYDVRKPRQGFWFNVPEDIVSFQDNYNLFLCDIQYATAHQMQKTLFMDTHFENTDSTGSLTIPAAPLGHTDAGDEQWRAVTAPAKKSIGGLGSIVYLERGITGTTPLVQFDGPTTDLKPLYEILSMQVRDIASDWCVKIKAPGEGSENSGFQVVTNEKDNLALREQRAQSFQAGLRRFYDVTQRLYPEMQEGTLKAEFAPPALPVNRLEQEQVWQYRLQNNCGTPVDYYMQTESLSEEDAIKKVMRDVEIRKMLAEAMPQPTATAEPVNASQNGGNPRKPANDN
jgi:hypothetical protein